MPRDRNPCVYILASAPRGTVYIGVTSDLPGRLYQHRHGVTEGFATRCRVHRLVYFEMAETMDAAIAREKQLKRWHRDWKLNLIERQNPEWNDLAPVLGIAERL
ncbi:GIY-YIG nuclease family protein [Sphingomonas soli]|uniref:GIY-YIG nuclease family protein n=1 Tax=Sphingomonas soli TaxID=266127 RepID=UPI0008337EF4|nr:GIY-YIG nuclease family protein [Sphingomonas soli]